MSFTVEARSRFRRPEEIDPITAGAEDVDFSPEQAMDVVNKVFTVGHERSEQLNALPDSVIKGLGDGDIYVEHTNTGQYSDFYDQANHAYLKKKYPWLHPVAGGSIGIDSDKAEESHGSLENFLGSIPHDDWASFITDLKGLENYPSLDDDGASELQMQESDRWMVEDGAPDLIKAMVEDADDAYNAFLLSKVTHDMVYEWCSETDHYPENQGEGSVWMDMDKLGAQSDTQDWFLNEVPDDPAGWLSAKRTAYDDLTGRAFDGMLKGLAQESEGIAATYNRLDAVSLWELFLAAFPDERTEDESPYWYFYKTYHAQPGAWRVGYAPRKAMNVDEWKNGYAQALDYLKNSERFHNLVANWFRRGPEGHPELKLEHLREAMEAEPDPDDAPTFMKYGGGLQEEVVYEDDKIVVYYPRDINAWNYHLRNSGLREIDDKTFQSFRYHDVFIVLGKQPADLTGHTEKRELGIIWGDVFGLKVWTGSIRSPMVGDLLNNPEYGPSIRRMLLDYYREAVEGDSNAGNVLLQIGGVKELRRADRKGHLSMDSYKIQVGLDYIKKHKYAFAAKVFGRPASTITPQGVWLVFSDVTDLTPVFVNEKAAETVFSNEHYDWFDHLYDRGNRPAVRDVIPFLMPEAIAHIRKVMQNRTVWFPDGGKDATGAYGVLTKKQLDTFDDATLLDWLKSPSDEDAGVFDDIIEAIQLAGVDILQAASQDKVYSDYMEAAIDAIGGKEHKWGADAKGRDTFTVFVPWGTVHEFAGEYLDKHEVSFDGTLEELAVGVQEKTVEVNQEDAGWSDVDKAYASDQLHRIFELEMPEAPGDPGQLTLPIGEGEDEDADALKRKYGVADPDYDLAAAEKEADAKGKTQFRAADAARAFLKRMKTESFDLDSPEAMPAMFSGIPVELEKRVFGEIREAASKNGIRVSDLRIGLEHDGLLPYAALSEAFGDSGFRNRYNLTIRFKVPTIENTDWPVWRNVLGRVEHLVEHVFSSDFRVEFPSVIEDGRATSEVILKCHLVLQAEEPPCPF